MKRRTLTGESGRTGCRSRGHAASARSPRYDGSAAAVLDDLPAIARQGEARRKYARRPNPKSTANSRPPVIAVRGDRKLLSRPSIPSPPQTGRGAGRIEAENILDAMEGVSPPTFDEPLGDRFDPEGAQPNADAGRGDRPRGRRPASPRAGRSRGTGACGRGSTHVGGTAFRAA